MNRILTLFCVAVVAASAPLAIAQSWPTKPIKLIVPFTPGGSQDVMGRLFAQKIGDALGQQVVVENKAGAGGQIATQEVARSTPDGYTLLLSTGAQMAIEPSLRPNSGYAPLKDFVHVVHLADAPLVLLAVPSLPVSNARELIAYSKANPGKVNTASTGNGTYTHLTLELFKSATGADLTHIAYKGAAPAFTDMLGGQVQTMFTTTASAQPYTSTNRLKALAVTSKKRSPLFPRRRHSPSSACRNSTSRYGSASPRLRVRRPRSSIDCRPSSTKCSRCPMSGRSSRRSARSRSAARRRLHPVHPGRHRALGEHHREAGIKPE
jgi:tripartite-type tricarboxylate transporter receptor subunit TctC